MPLLGYNNAIHLLRAGAIAGLYCTVGYAHIVSPRLRGVNHLSVFCLGGGGLSLRAVGNYQVEKSSLLLKSIKHRYIIISLTADRILFGYSCPALSLYMRAIYYYFLFWWGLS
jgi:hypothetical protein